MLENLLNTKLKKRILAILFRFPQRSFSRNELKELSAGATQPVALALREFARGEVVNMAQRGARKYYRVNPRFPLYGELQDLIAEEGFAVEDQVAKRLKLVPNLRLLVLSGIFTLQPHLPVDVVVVGDYINRLRLQRELAEVERLIGQEVNFAVLGAEEYQYRRMMNDRFIRDVFDYPHVIVLNTFKK
jgi:hypothetical protein